MIFVFDLDDTICDADGYSKEYIQKFFVEHDLPYKQIAQSARFAEKYFDWDMDTAIAWYKENGDKMMTEFPYKGNAVEVINKLYDLGHKIIISTARADDWHADPVGITKQWLKENKLKYHKLYVSRDDKEEICKKENADVFVDDDLKIATKVSEYFKTCKGMNKRVFLYTTKYNKGFKVDSEIKRIENFDELLKRLSISDS